MFGAYWANKKVTKIQGLVRSCYQSLSGKGNANLLIVIMIVMVARQYRLVVCGMKLCGLRSCGLLLICDPNTGS